MRVLRPPIGQGAVRIELDEADAMRTEHIDGLEFDGMNLQTLVVPNARRILDPIRERLALQSLPGVVERDRGGISDGHLLVTKDEAEILHDVYSNGICKTHISRYGGPATHCYGLVWWRAVSQHEVRMRSCGLELYKKDTVTKEPRAKETQYY